jgi:hypothetical protein
MNAEKRSIEAEERWETRSGRSLPAVLVVGSVRDTQLSDAVFETGLTPVFRETILAAIAALRKEQFHAVVINPRCANVDALELILNVRDVDDGVRVFVISDEKLDLSGLQGRRRVSVVSRDELIRKLTPTVVEIGDPGGLGAWGEDEQADRRNEA